MRLTIVFLLFNSSITLANIFQHSYYPKKFKTSLKANEFTEDSLKEELFNIISKIHVKNNNSEDEISSICPKGRECYQQVRSLSYKEARKHLFGHLHLEKKDGKEFVKDLYCDKEFGKEIGVGKYKIPNHLKLNW